MHKDVLNFIEFLKGSGYVTRLYKGNHSEHSFYYDIVGFIDDKYFNIVLKETTVFKEFDAHIVYTTDCRDLVEFLLKEFNLI